MGKWGLESDEWGLASGEWDGLVTEFVIIICSRNHLE